jgi:hypothetical protein
MKAFAVVMAALFALACGDDAAEQTRKECATYKDCGGEEICYQGLEKFYCGPRSDFEDEWSCCECMSEADSRDTHPEPYPDMRECAQALSDGKYVSYSICPAWHNCVYHNFDSWRDPAPCAFLPHRDTSAVHAEGEPCL